MKPTVKIRLIITHGLLLGLLTALSFWGALKLYINFVPRPLGAAFKDLNNFTHIVGIGALILGCLQAMLLLYVYPRHQSWYWVLGIALAFLFGGLASFFSIWPIWVLVSLVSLLLDGLLAVLIQHALSSSTSPISR